MIQMLKIWQTFVDKFHNFLSQLLDWRFNPRQNIGQIKLTAELGISGSEMKRIISHECDPQNNTNIIAGAFCTGIINGALPQVALTNIHSTIAMANLHILL